MAFYDLHAFNRLNSELFKLSSFSSQFKEFSCNKQKIITHPDKTHWSLNIATSVVCLNSHVNEGSMLMFREEIFTDFNKTHDQISLVWLRLTILSSSNIVRVEHPMGVSFLNTTVASSRKCSCIILHFCFLHYWFNSGLAHTQSS